MSVDSALTRTMPIIINLDRFIAQKKCTISAAAVRTILPLAEHVTWTDLSGVNAQEAGVANLGHLRRSDGSCAGAMVRLDKAAIDQKIDAL